MLRPNVTARLESSGSGFRYTCDADEVEDYDSSGRSVSMALRGGTFPQTIAYNAQGRAQGVSDAFGRILTFGYDTSARLVSVVDPAGGVYAYTYDFVGNLASVRSPDQVVRQFAYANSSRPNALTAILDETGTQWASYTYDSQGRVSTGALAGGASSVSIAYYADGSRDVVDGRSAARRYAFSLIHEVPRRIRVDKALCPTCGNATMTTGYTPSGFVASIIDYRGTRTDYARDTRGLEQSRTEATGTPIVRTTGTTWHPTYRLPLTVNRPGQRTSYTYDASGRTTSKVVVDTSSGASRSWSYGYDASGLLATIDGPRTDASDVTQMTYDVRGNLATRTNGLGQTTRYTAYDAHGRLLSMTDPNGLVTTLTYDARGRLIRRDAGGQVMTHTYHPAGMPLRTTLADGSWIENAYDPAHRLVGMLDSAGNRVRYTLDSQGNRETQEHFDGAGVSRYFRGFQYDNDRRLVAEIDAQGQYAVRHAYDQNGNRSSTTDASGRTTAVNHDPLNRRDTMTDADGGVTRSAYDARDNLVQVTDPINVTTAYTYDGLDNLIRETSPTSGVSTYGYDSAGNQTTPHLGQRQDRRARLRRLEPAARRSLRRHRAGQLRLRRRPQRHRPPERDQRPRRPDDLGLRPVGPHPGQEPRHRGPHPDHRVHLRPSRAPVEHDLPLGPQPHLRLRRRRPRLGDRHRRRGPDRRHRVAALRRCPHRLEPAQRPQRQRVIDRNGRHVEYSFEASWRDLTRDADGRIITQLASRTWDPARWRRMVTMPPSA